jgi:hypothetical protein
MPPLVIVAAPDRETRRLQVYTYRDTGTALEFVATQVIERPNGGSSSPFYLSDVSADGRHFTIHDVSDHPLSFMSAVRLYDVESRRLTRVRTGQLPWATLFLAEELRHRLDSEGPLKQIMPAMPMEQTSRDR